MAPPDYVVVLFYKYTPIDETTALVESQRSLCKALSLCGRIRCSTEGINGNLGGKKSSVHTYIEEMRKIPAFADTDFKLGSLTDDRPAEDQMMKGLTIKITGELVSLGGTVDPSLPSGRHLTPQEFHSFLDDAERGKRADVVLLDTRNVYETEIGRFQLKGAKTVDPETRQFSELPRRFQDRRLLQQLKGKHILMYCTGGVRCERASALLKSCGSGFENVYQLSGGIHRYCERYGDSGYFRGKNFVFDDRMCTGPAQPECGRCSQCQLPFDDYTLGCRCVNCRMRIIVCKKCYENSPEAPRVCKMCVARKTAESNPPETRIATLGSDSPRVSCIGEVVTILCLHDDGQTPKGCQAVLRRIEHKLQRQVRLNYLQSPHGRQWRDEGGDYCWDHLIEHICKENFSGLLGIGSGATVVAAACIAAAAANRVKRKEDTEEVPVSKTDMTNEGEGKVKNTFLEDLAAKLEFAIFLNGEPPKGAFLSDNIANSHKFVPTLHIDVRTRQYDKTASRSKERQIEDVKNLLKIFRGEEGNNGDILNHILCQPSETSSNIVGGKRKRSQREGRIPPTIRSHQVISSIRSFVTTAIL